MDLGCVVGYGEGCLCVVDEVVFDLVEVLLFGGFCEGLVCRFVDGACGDCGELFVGVVVCVVFYVG